MLIERKLRLQPGSSRLAVTLNTQKMHIKSPSHTHKRIKKFKWRGNDKKDSQHSLPPTMILF